MYAIMGATGNTGKVIARALLAEGQEVRAIGRSADRLSVLGAAGAEAFVCDATDTASLAKALSGVRAAYAMIPPNMTSQDYRADQNRTADSIAGAIEQAGVKYVVSLSSIGADKVEGTGPIAGLHYLEQRLNRIPDLNVLHLRAAYFMENTLAQIGTIQAMGVTAGPLRPDVMIPMIATRDIGAAAGRALLDLGFNNKQTRELLGPRAMNMAEVTTIIGKAIGKSDLNYVQVPDEQVQAALTHAGVSLNVANLILEMGAALNSAHVRALEERSSENTTPTSYESFVAEEFVPRYRPTSASA